MRLVTVEWQSNSQLTPFDSLGVSVDSSLIRYLLHTSDLFRWSDMPSPTTKIKQCKVVKSYLQASVSNECGQNALPKGVVERPSFCCGTQYTKEESRRRAALAAE